MGEQLTKSRELQQSKESTSGHLLPVQLKVLSVQLAGKSTEVKFYRYNCMELTGIVQEFNPYARALSSTNQNGKITFEGAIKGEGHK